MRVIGTRKICPISPKASGVLLKQDAVFNDNKAEALAADLDSLLERETRGLSVFMGCIGEGKAPLSRSIHFLLDDLICM